jgi:hypothetical protein
MLHFNMHAMSKDFPHKQQYTTVQILNQFLTFSLQNLKHFPLFNFLKKVESLISQLFISTAFSYMEQRYILVFQL